MTLRDDIKAAILAGRYAPGRELSQTDLAREYGVSRIPVRDALLGLAAEELVEVLPGRGARVVLLSQDAVTEIYDLRILLEGDLTGRAVCAADDAFDDALTHMLRRTSLEAGRPGWQAGDWDFHRTLYERASRPRQLRLVEHLRRLCAVHVARYDALSDHTPQWLADHEAIVAACLARRPDEACHVLRGHLERARDSLLRGMARSGQDQLQGGPAGS